MCYFLVYEFLIWYTMQSVNKQTIVVLKLYKKVL